MGWSITHLPSRSVSRPVFGVTNKCSGYSPLLAPSLMGKSQLPLKGQRRSDGARWGGRWWRGGVGERERGTQPHSPPEARRGSGGTDARPEGEGARIAPHRLTGGQDRRGRGEGVTSPEGAEGARYPRKWGRIPTRRERQNPKNQNKMRQNVPNIQKNRQK